MVSRTDSLLDISVSKPCIISPICLIGEYFINLSILLITQVKSKGKGKGKGKAVPLQA